MNSFSSKFWMVFPLFPCSMIFFCLVTFWFIQTNLNLWDYLIFSLFLFFYLGLGSTNLDLNNFSTNNCLPEALAHWAKMIVYKLLNAILFIIEKCQEKPKFTYKVGPSLFLKLSRILTNNRTIQISQMPNSKIHKRAFILLLHKLSALVPLMFPKL